MTTPKGAARRDAIVTAASAILVEEGLEAVTHRTSAARARVPLGSTTYYFTGLDDLRRAAADRIADDDIARMDAAIDALPAGQHGADDLASIIVRLVVPAGDHAVITWYERYARAAREPVLASAARRTNRAALDAVDLVLRSAGWRSLASASDGADSSVAALVLATVDGAILGALADGLHPEAARDHASSLLKALIRDSLGQRDHS